MYMKTMKSSVLSAKEFFQLTVNSLLELCTHCIDGHRIVSIEGCLLLTLDTGDKVELNILQQDFGNLLKSIQADDGNKSSSAVKSDMDKNMDGDLPVPVNTETGLTVEDSVELESLDASPAEHVNKADSAGETGLPSSSVDEGDECIPDVESMPSAVLQANGEFMCSSCGEKTKCARAIKRHILTHMTGQLLEPSITPCLETADDVNVMQKSPKKQGQGGGYKRLPRPENKKDSSKQWRSYVCKDCENVFTSSALLDLHRVQMHRPHQCQKCGNVMIGRRNFSKHVRNEHPGLHIYKAQKTYVCEYCSRTFHQEAQLKDHISTVHLGSIEHRCDQCGKVLGSAETLKIHQRQLHERRFQQTCDGCGRQFTRLASLINHLTCTHPHLLPDKYRSRLDELVCKECDLTFSRRSSLQRHLEVQHGGAPNHMCPICSRRFRCQRYVHRHLRSHHQGNTDTPAVADEKSAMVLDVRSDDSTYLSNVFKKPAVDSPAL